MTKHHNKHDHRGLGSTKGVRIVPSENDVCEIVDTYPSLIRYARKRAEERASEQEAQGLSPSLAR